MKRGEYWANMVLLVVVVFGISTVGGGMVDVVGDSEKGVRSLGGGPTVLYGCLDARSDCTAAPGERFYNATASSLIGRSNRRCVN